MSVLPTVAVNLEVNLLRTVLPLLNEGAVGAIEWSYDALFGVREIPSYFTGLLDAFAQSQRLIGHGIYFSVCSAGWRREQSAYLEQLRALRRRFPMEQVTEHFGFFTGADFHRGAPIAPPFTTTLLRIARDRMARLREAADCPVGLENLALSYARDDVFRQYAFLEEVLGFTDGFLILDLHNLYCQAHNFDISPDRLVDRYPLHLVREIHLSGGSWAPHPGAPEGKVRRDTHDAAVPTEVFRLLRTVIPRCPLLRYVTLEQLGPALKTEEAGAQFRADFQAMSAICGTAAFPGRSAVHPPTEPEPISALPVVDHPLAREQTLLSTILESSESAATARDRLLRSALAGSAWRIEEWEPHMLHTVWSIARKWR